MFDELGDTPTRADFHELNASLGRLAVIDADEANEVLRADAIATGAIDGVPGHVVVEVSATCGADGVDRAERRAGILRKAGLMAVPLVACEVVSRELVAYARSRQVRVWCNGTMVDAAA
jgi:hypothetical protein